MMAVPFRNDLQGFNICFRKEDSSASCVTGRQLLLRQFALRFPLSPLPFTSPSLTFQNYSEKIGILRETFPVKRIYQNCYICAKYFVFCGTGYLTNAILPKLFRPSLTNKLSTDKQCIACFFFIVHFARCLAANIFVKLASTSVSPGTKLGFPA